MKFYTTAIILFFYTIQSISAQYTPYEDSLMQVIDNEKDKYLVFDAYFDLVDELFITDRIKEGNIFYQNMSKFGKKNGIKSTEGCLSLLDGYKAYYHDNNTLAGLNYVLLSIEQLEAVRDTSMRIKCKLASAIGEVGYYYEEVGFYDKALDYYLKSLDYAIKNKCFRQEIEAYNFLFFMYSEYFNDDKLGLSFLKKSLKVAEEVNDKDFISTLNGNLAMLYIKMGDLEKGRFFVERAIETRQQLKDTLGLAHIYLEEARLLLKTNDLAKAEESINQCLAFAPKKCDWCYSAYITAGQIAKKSKNYSEAERNFLTAKMIVEKSGSLSGQYWALLDLAMLARDRKELEKATNYYSAMFTVKDSMDRQWKISNAMNIETQAKTKTVEEEKKKLEFEKTLYLVKAKAQRKLVILFFLLLVITLVGSFIIFLQKQNLFKAYQILVQKNRLLTTTMQKNEVKVSEIKLQKNSAQQVKQQQEEDLLKKLEDDLLEKIEIALATEKIFLDNNLSLASFAQHLNTNTSYLSRVINNIYNKRFSVLINEYRVKEVLTYFETDELKEVTIFALAQKAGFSSKSAFNTAFKEYTGVTPSFYLKNASIAKTE